MISDTQAVQLLSQPNSGSPPQILLVQATPSQTSQVGVPWPSCPVYSSSRTGASSQIAW